MKTKFWPKKTFYQLDPSEPPATTLRSCVRRSDARAVPPPESVQSRSVVTANTRASSLGSVISRASESSPRRSESSPGLSSCRAQCSWARSCRAQCSWARMSFMSLTPRLSLAVASQGPVRGSQASGKSTGMRARSVCTAVFPIGKSRTHIFDTCIIQAIWRHIQCRMLTYDIVYYVIGIDMISYMMSSNAYYIIHPMLWCQFHRLWCHPKKLWCHIWYHCFFCLFLPFYQICKILYVFRPLVDHKKLRCHTWCHIWY